MLKYKLHWRLSDQPLILTELVFDPNCYGKLDYRVLIRKDNTATFLSQQGFVQAARLGNNLLDSIFLARLRKKIDRNTKKLIDTSILEKINTANNQALIKIWGNIHESVCGFAETYLYFEQPVLAPLENIILKKVSDPVKLTALLSNPELTKKYGFSEFESKALSLLIEFGRLKLRFHHLLTPWSEAINKLSVLLARKYYLSPQQVLSMTSAELQALIKYGRRPSLETLNGRWRGCVLTPAGGKKRWNIITGNEFFTWQKKLEKINTDFVKGESAYGGRVSGQVIIHTKWMGVTELPPGSILVAGNTNPHIVKYLKNVKAIVTDEGGLTCHAAIVARELKIPCVVGTEVGTQVFKDGDRVEVDAKKGIIRKI
jgi:phosphohistidine swiveling domain-containing protein